MINPKQYSFYTFTDQVYSDFMMDIMQNLEPISLPKKKFIFDELEEVQLIYFFMKGTYEIGYSINLEKKFMLRYKNYSVIGIYNVTFFKRSPYIYRSATPCSGYFIRRHKWRDIMENNDGPLCTEFKDQIAKEFEVKIKKKMDLKKSSELMRLSLRADFESHKFTSGIYDQGILKSALREQD